jgi:hypothetical protein
VGICLNLTKEAVVRSACLVAGVAVLVAMYTAPLWLPKEKP